MALSVEKLLTDAHTLVVHLKDHDVGADNIIAATQSLFKKIEAMKQYQDDIVELNEIAKHRPRSTMILGLAQENRQIRELQQENRELQAALEEHQSALELIMQKYREHTFKLLQSNKVEKAIQEQEVVNKDSVCQLMDKIDEMAGVMQKAIEVDEQLGRADEERLSCLELENKALREMLEISTTSKVRILPPEMRKSKEYSEEGIDSEDDKTDSEHDSSILLSPDMNKQNQEETNENELEESDSTDSSMTSTDSSVTTTSLILLGESKSLGDIQIEKAEVEVNAEVGTPVKRTMSSIELKKN